MERTEEALRERVRETPLSERLTTCEKYIASMCAERRPPKMTIPLQHYDEDFYIYTTLTDAQATIAALEETILKMGENAAVVAKDAMAAKEQVAALQADNRTYINERHENMKQIEQLQAMNNRLGVRVETLESQLTQRTAECDALKLVNDTHMKTVMKLSHVVEQRTAEFQRHDGELQQICGQALGYPWFKDDQKNFPGATEKDGVCVGEHVGITIAQELANAYRKRTAELEAAIEEQYMIIPQSGDMPISWKEAYDDLQAELERVNGERDDMHRAAQGMSNDLTGMGQKYEELRTMVAALPKVEGDWTVSCALAVTVVTGGIVRDISEVVAAIVQHRQGMEG